MSAFFAFLHHVVAFTLVAAIAVEFVLLRGDLTPQTARTLLRADALYGVSAALLIIVGVLRIVYFEKGANYYLDSIPFIAKVSLFALVGVLSIYPTRAFLSWRPALKEGRLPSVTPQQIRSIRTFLHLELMGVVLILLCAALMAKGLGFRP